MSLKFEKIKLEDPDLKKGKNLMEIISKRHSERQFSGKELTLKQISELLWVCYYYLKIQNSSFDLELVDYEGF